MTAAWYSGDQATNSLWMLVKNMSNEANRKWFVVTQRRIVPERDCDQKDVPWNPFNWIEPVSRYRAIDHWRRSVACTSLRNFGGWMTWRQLFVFIQTRLNPLPPFGKATPPFAWTPANHHPGHKGPLFKWRRHQTGRRPAFRGNETHSQTLSLGWREEWCGCDQYSINAIAQFGRRRPARPRSTITPAPFHPCANLRTLRKDDTVASPTTLTTTTDTIQAISNPLPCQGEWKHYGFTNYP